MTEKQYTEHEATDAAVLMFVRRLHRLYPEAHKAVFTPSRLNGTICVARRRGPSGLGDVELCGYPLGHPIHATVNTPAEARTGISDRAAAALADVAELRRRFSEYHDVNAICDRIAQALRGER
jgi:hypothetical protein